MKTKIKIRLLTLTGFLFVANAANAQQTTNYVTKFDATPPALINSSIFDNGNVGIGTPSPVSALNVAGTTGLTWGQITTGLVTLGTNVTGASLFVNTPGQTGWSSGLGVDGTYSSSLSTVNIKAYGTRWTGYSSNLTFATSNAMTLSEAMRITSAGYVGIGTTSPLSKLDARGSSAKASTAAYQNIISASSSDAASPLTLKMGIKTDVTATNRYGAIGVDDDGTARNLSLQQYGGSVGIGTTSPGYVLEVRGNGKFSSNLTVGAYTFPAADGTSNQVLSTNGAGTVVWASASATGWSLLGNSGTTAGTNFIGTSDAVDVVLKRNNVEGLRLISGGLEVNGTIKISGGSPGVGKVLTSDANGLASWSSSPPSGGWSTTGNSGTVDGTNFIGTTDNVPLNIRVNNQKAGRIDPTRNNAFWGYCAGYSNTTGENNTATGTIALYSNQIGLNNTAYGAHTLSNATGYANSAFGYEALYYTTTGGNNSAFGDQALNHNLGGSDNVAIGYQSAIFNGTGSHNTAVGKGSLVYNQSGNYNTALGSGAYPTGSGANDNSTALGANTNISASNQVRVGDANVTSIGGQVGWTTLSDGRFKKEIKEAVPGLDFITKLRPVTYNLDMDRIASYLHTPDSIRSKEAEAVKGKMLQTGFIAQEVEKTANDLGFDFSGVDKPKNKEDYYGLRYAEFVVPLVKAVQEQQQMIDSLKTETAKQDAINKSLQQQIDKLVASNRFSNGNINNTDNSTNVDLSDKNIVVLEQNVPNPFAEQTTINYVLPDNVQRAAIIFIDQSNKIIKTVELNEKGKGTINVFASDLSNGLYTYSLIFDGQTVETKKMVKSK